MKAIARTQILSKGNLLPPGSEIELSAKRFQELHAAGAVMSVEEVAAQKQLEVRRAALAEEEARAVEEARARFAKRLAEEEAREKAEVVKAAEPPRQRRTRD